MLRSLVLGAVLVCGASAQSAPSIDAVVNAASGSGSIGPSSWATIYGHNLSACTAQAPNCTDANGNPIPVSITANGEAVQLSYISPTQANILTPAAPGTYTLSVTNGGASTDTKLVVTPTGIGLFRGLHNVAAARNPDSTANGYTNPLPPGGTIALYGTGGGLPNDTETLPDGSTLECTATPAVLINGQPMGTIDFAGNAPGLSGVNQYNVTLPATIATGAATITFTLGGVSDSVDIFIASDTNIIAGNIRGPGMMSDGVIHDLAAVAGTATSTLGTSQFSVTHSGNYLVRASGATQFSLAGNGVWENYADNVAANGPTVNPDIAALPHCVHGRERRLRPDHTDVDERELLPAEPEAVVRHAWWWRRHPLRHAPLPQHRSI